jgi:formamidopyrimidine-DNA glycosylase
MPELPEVETIVRDLARVLPGRRFADVEVLRPDLIEGEAADDFVRALRGRQVAGVARRAKNILIGLAGDLLVVNLGMTGRLLVAHAGAPAPSHPGVRIELDDGRTLWYHDVRRFGRLQRFSDEAWLARDAVLGVEPLGEAFTSRWLHDALGRSRSPVKVWLMDQRRVVGVGNIYASEALHRARIDPRRPAGSVAAEEAERLREAVRTVLQEAIDFRGTTLLDYRDAAGEEGGFAARLRVYDRAGEPCRTCGAPIERIVQGGRSTFFCAACQR